MQLIPICHSTSTNFANIPDGHGCTGKYHTHLVWIWIGGYKNEAAFHFGTVGDSYLFIVFIKLTSTPPFRMASILHSLF